MEPSCRTTIQRSPRSWTSARRRPPLRPSRARTASRRTRGSTRAAETRMSRRRWLRSRWRRTGPSGPAARRKTPMRKNRKILETETLDETSIMPIRVLEPPALTAKSLVTFPGSVRKRAPLNVSAARNPDTCPGIVRPRALWSVFTATKPDTCPAHVRIKVLPDRRVSTVIKPDTFPGNVRRRWPTQSASTAIRPVTCPANVLVVEDVATDIHPADSEDSPVPDQTPSLWERKKLKPLGSSKMIFKQFFYRK